MWSGSGVKVTVGLDKIEDYSYFSLDCLISFYFMHVLKLKGTRDTFYSIAPIFNIVLVNCIFFFLGLQVSPLPIQTHKNCNQEIYHRLENYWVMGGQL